MTGFREYWNKYIWMGGKEQNRRLNLERQGIHLRQHSGVRTAVISTSPPLNDPNLKCGIDIAGVWDGVIDSARCKDYGMNFVIVKAADGTITATKLYENATLVQDVGLGLGLYFWLYPNSKVSTKAQGQKWASLVNTIRPSVAFVDYEWTSWNGQPANPEESDLLETLYWLASGWSGPVGIYSAPGYLMDHPLTDRAKPWLWWQAQYGVLQPSPVVPFGTNWIMWQQSDRWGPASDWGIDPMNAHVTDGDVMPNSAFYSIFTGSEPPPPPADVITSPYPGVVVTSGRRFDSDFRMIAISPASIVEEHVTAPGSANIAENIPGTIVTNGGDFNMTTYQAVGLLRSQGREYSPQADAEPAIGFDAQHVAAIDHRTMAGWTDAIGLKRYLVIDGLVSPNTSPAWDAREPRTIYGLRQDGTRLILSVKGRQAGQSGITLYQAADILIEFGAQRAGDADGGDSVQSRVGDDLFLGTATRRQVADFWTITVKEETPMTYRYSAVSPSSRSMRKDHTVLSASTNTIPANTVVQGDELFTAAVDVYSSGVKVQAVGDQWLHVLQMGSQAVDGWTAIIHLGKTQMTLTDNGVTPPPPPPPADDVILRSWTVVIGLKQPDGSYKDYTFHDTDTI